MGQDDEVNAARPAPDEAASDGPPSHDSGPRRSTFTPAPEGAFHAVFGSQASSIPVDAPPPNPATAVVPPPGSALPSPPQRRSLPDSELLFTLGDDSRREGSALDAIERLQEQLEIRGREAREFRNWESSMRAIGTPEALDIVEEVRTTFTEAIQVIPPFEASEPTPAPAEPLIYDLVEPTTPPRTEGGTVIVPGAAEAGDTPSVTGDDAPDALNPAASGLDEIAASDADEPSEASASEPVAPHDAGPTEPLSDGASTEPVMIPETVGLEPTALAQRSGRAFRVFWLWFAANSSALSVVLGAVLLGMGMSLRQAILATLAGIALSFLPTGLATLAAKWSGQPTILVSRASFGHAGNLLPAVLALITRVLWGAALLWFLGLAGSALLHEADAGVGMNTNQLAIIIVGVGVLIAVPIAFFGYRVIVWTQLVLSVASAALIIMVMVLTWPLIDMTNALSIADGPWLLVATGAILVFSFIGLAWASGAGDVARYQRPTGSGAGSMLTASFGSVLPPFALISYGAVLAASDPDLASGFLTDPVSTLAGTVPPSLLLPLVAATGIGLLSGVILTVYSAGFAVQALGVRVRRDVSALVIGIVAGISAIVLTAVGLGFDAMFRDLATTIAVPTAAWLGIFAGEMMIRTRRFETDSLLRQGGVYPRVRWVNLIMLVIATAVGYGLTTAAPGWLAWQGYLMPVLGIRDGSDLAGVDIGVLVALAITLVTPLVAGIPSIRRQEGAQTDEDEPDSIPPASSTGETGTARR